MTRETKEEIISLIDSKDMREYFTKNLGRITKHDYMMVVGYAPVSLERKRDLLRQIDYSDDAKIVLEAAEEALDRLYHVKPGKELLQVSLYCGSSQECRTQCSMEKTWTVRDFPAAQRGMQWYMRQLKKRQQYLFEEQHSLDISYEPNWDWRADALKEMGRPQWFWQVSLIRTTSKSGIWLPEYEFICDPWGEPQYVASEESDLEVEQFRTGFLSGGGFYPYYPPVPFWPGDILHIDCTPYPPYGVFCLAADVTVNYVQYDGPHYAREKRIDVLWPLPGGRVELGDLNGGEGWKVHGQQLAPLPALLRAERWEGPLPESCTFLKGLSKRIKKDYMLGKRLVQSMKRREEDDFSVWDPWAYNHFDRFPLP